MQFINKNDIICTDKYLSLASKNIAYLKTDLLTHGLQSLTYRGETFILHPSKIWISGHSDYSIDSNIFYKYHHNCKVWFTINKDFKCDKLKALPLGVTNFTNESPVHIIYGNTDIMYDIMQQPRIIENLVYMNFNINTNSGERQKCYNMFYDKDWVTKGENITTLEGREYFLKKLRNHTFVLCPQGNGIDTHRLWETLYMGSFPIVINNCAMDEFNDLPILFIDDWNVVTYEFLTAKYEEMCSKNWNMDKLKFSYWKDLIIQAAEDES